MDDATQLAPPVVAVVVAHEPGDWFDEVLESLAGQDYPNLQVVVVDTSDDAEALAPRVGRVLPGAFLRPLGANPGFGAAANDALRLVEGSGFFCFLHDDVALAPDAIRQLVEELYRSNAGLVGPKLLEWEAPERLQSVGYGADKFGELAPIAEEGELDQEQHDAVRDVFCLSTACLLVRTDLFRELGGFDEAIRHFGDGLDLCWRAHVSGARVLIVPGAAARHRGALADRAGLDDSLAQREAERNRLRTVASSYGVGHLVRVLPQYAVATGVEALASLLRGHPARAGALFGAWGSAWRGVGPKRSELKAIREVPDAEVRRLQVRGSARLRTLVRLRNERREGSSAVTDMGRGAVDFVRTGAHRGVVAAWVALALALLVGSRSLLRDGVPRLGTFLAEPAGGPWSMLGAYLQGWWAHGVGAAVAVPTGAALAGLAGVASFGATGLLRTLAVVGPLLLGWVGAWRLGRPLGSGRARVGALAAYALLPLGLDAIAAADQAALFAYAAMPWVLSRLARASGLAPYGDEQGEAGPGVVRRSLLAQVAALALLVAVVTAFVPSFPFVVVGVALALVLGSLPSGGTLAALRGFGVAVIASVLAYVLHLPWSAGLEAADLAVLRPASASPLGLDDLVRGSLTSHASVLTFGVLVAAVVPLLVGRGWRLAWAARGAAVALVTLAVALLATQGRLPVDPPSLGVLLAPLPAALALMAGCGGAASVVDVRGLRLGWRQPLAVLGLAGLVVAAVPFALWAVDGRWELPRADFATRLALLPGAAAPTGQRALWLADPRALPQPGWPLVGDVAYAISNGPYPDLSDTWPGHPDQAGDIVTQAVVAAARGETNRLGAMLAPLGIRYVMAASSGAPASQGWPRYELPVGLTSALDEQLDLRRIELDDALVVYENTQWIPSRAALTPAAAAVSDRAGFDQLVATDVSGSAPVLPGSDPLADSGQGPLPARTVLVATPSDARWQLEVGGTRVLRRPAFGWANAFDVPAGGTGTLSYDTPVTRTVAVVLQALLWLVVIAVAARGATAAGRRRRREQEAAVDAAQQVPAEPVIDLGTWPADEAGDAVDEAGNAVTPDAGAPADDAPTVAP